MIAKLTFRGFESPVQHYYAVVQCLVAMKKNAPFRTVMGMSLKQAQCGCKKEIKVNIKEKYAVL